MSGSGSVRIGACRVGEPVNSGCIRRETGPKPLNDFHLKAGLRRDGSPAQISPSEFRLKPEVCEGLQARVHGNTVLYREMRPPAIAARLVMHHAHTSQKLTNNQKQVN